MEFGVLDAPPPSGDEIASSSQKQDKEQPLDEKDDLITSCENYSLVSICEEWNPSVRDTMEDVHKVIPRLEVEGERYISYFGVYDGHGGRGVVEFLDDELDKFIVDEINKNQEDGFDLPQFLSDAYDKCDRASQEGVLKKLNTTTPDVSGATAASVLLIKGEEPFPKALYVANCGDTRVVLCEEVFEQPGTYESRRLTIDHKAVDSDERMRIKKLGGSVKNGRVMRILNVARSFGDHFLKKYVIATPFCPDPVLIESSQHCPFFILACDGLWDVVTDEEAMTIVLTEYLQKGPFQNAADLLVAKAMERDTTDNITVMVVFI